MESLLITLASSVALIAVCLIVATLRSHYDFKSLEIGDYVIVPHFSLLRDTETEKLLVTYICKRDNGRAAYIIAGGRIVRFRDYWMCGMERLKYRPFFCSGLYIGSDTVEFIVPSEWVTYIQMSDGLEIKKNMVDGRLYDFVKCYDKDGFGTYQITLLQEQENCLPTTVKHVGFCQMFNFETEKRVMPVCFGRWGNLTNKSGKQ